MATKYLIASMRFNYGLQALEVGDAFEAEEGDADKLVKLGRAVPSKAKAKAEPEAEYSRRDMVATKATAKGKR